MTTSAAWTISSVQGLGNSFGDVDADLGHGRDGGRVDLEAGFGAAGPGDGTVAGESLEPAERHLGAAGVVDAEEQHDGQAVVGLALDLGEGLEALAGEPFGHEREEVVELGSVGELVVAGGQEQLDRLGTEDAVELPRQVPGGGAQGQPLVDRQL